MSHLYCGHAGLSGAELRPLSPARSHFFSGPGVTRSSSEPMWTRDMGRAALELSIMRHFLCLGSKISPAASFQLRGNCHRRDSFGGKDCELAGISKAQSHTDTNCCSQITDDWMDGDGGTAPPSVWTHFGYFLNARTLATSALISSSVRPSAGFILVLSPSLMPSLMALVASASVKAA